jgi:hypothetical protein
VGAASQEKEKGEKKKRSQTIRHLIPLGKF